MSENVNPYQQAPTPLSPYEETQTSLLTHVLGIFFGFVSALVFFVLYRHRGPFVRNHVVTEWNFQLTSLIIQFVCVGVAVAGSFSTFFSPHGVTGAGAVVPFFIGYGVTWVVMILRVIFGIIAAVAANRGKFYRYPLAFRFVRE